jgi:hypothetical protein
VIIKLINETDQPIVLKRRVEFRRSSHPTMPCGEQVIKPGESLRGFVRGDTESTWTIYAGCDVLIDAPKSLFKMEKI